MRFRIKAMLDEARPCEAIVEIDRKSGLLSVRPLYRRRAFVLPLADVATMIVQRILRQEAASQEGTRRRARVKRGKL